jgi:hypothetical protein
MAKTKTPSGISVTEVIEVQLYIPPRGRSTMNGTVVTDGVVRSVKHDLNESEKSAIKDLVSTWLNVSNG